VLGWTDKEKTRAIKSITQPMATVHGPDDGPDGVFSIHAGCSEVRSNSVA
jgi:hypothetical protein